MHHQPALRCGPTHLLLLPERDLGHRPGDLAGHKRLAAARGLVVEQDAVADVHPVGLAVCDVARTGRRGKDGATGRGPDRRDGACNGGSASESANDAPESMTGGWAATIGSTFEDQGGSARPGR